ncbi:PIN domain-containing protein [uncultured Sphingomonas sp.]|uniref:PIN domain-containing protein n=1 Tax=uncultured Sphingomonas sp. TaxID=158754 RepID=UPI0025D182CB|nr:PIN domain-containing protein [uncultured Sphingomonas sp.]
MLLTDTNILQRVSRGRAMRHVATLRAKGVPLATTDRNAFELHRNLVGQLGLDDDEAMVEVERVLAPFMLIEAGDYDYLRDAARARLRQGGKSDWPTLAAALAFGGQIWTEDVDFFGVGVAVWTTNNLPFLQHALDD